MGLNCASLFKGIDDDCGFSISVRDKGDGMQPEALNPIYLTTGSERRKEPKRGGTTSKFKRRLLGVDGEGSLVPVDAAMSQSCFPGDQGPTEGVAL